MPLAPEDYEIVDIVVTTLVVQPPVAQPFHQILTIQYSRIPCCLLPGKSCLIHGDWQEFTSDSAESAENKKIISADSALSALMFLLIANR